MVAMTKPGAEVPHQQNLLWKLCLVNLLEHSLSSLMLWSITSSTRTRRGGSCLRFDYKTFSSIELAHAVRRACLLCTNLLHCCCPRTWPACDHVAMQHQANIFFTLHTALFTPCTALFTPCTSRFTLALHIPQLILSQIILILPHLTSSHLIPSLLTYHLIKQVLLNYFHVIRALKQHHLNSSQLRCTLESSYRQSLHKVLPSTTLYYKACTTYFPVLIRTTKLAQSTSQHYFVLQSLHKALPSTTLYYKACTKYFPVLPYYKACTKYFSVLLRTTKLAQSTSQYYFVLQILHNVLPSTTLYYKACTKYFPVLLRTTKLAQKTSQHYFVIQSLHKARPSATSYYKACTKYFPQHTHTPLTHHLPTHNLPTHTTCSHAPYTYTNTTYPHAQLTHTPLAHTQLTHTPLTHTPLTHTHTQLTHTHHLLTHHFPTHNLTTHNLPTHNLLTHNLHTHNLLTHHLLSHNLLTHTTYPHTTYTHTTYSHTTYTHTHNLPTRHLLTHHLPTHTHTHHLPTHNLLTHTTYPHTTYSHTTYSHTTYPHTTYSHTTKTHTTYTHTHTPTTYPHTTFSHTTYSHTFYSHTFVLQSLRTAPPSTPKLKLHNRISTQLPKKVLKHYCSLNAATPLRFTMSSCKRHKYCARSRSAKQPWRSHYNAICRHWVAKHTRTTRNSARNCSSKTGSRRRREKSTILKHFLKRVLKGKSSAPKWEKSADKSLSQTWCSHSNTIYDGQLQKTIVLRTQP